MKYEQKLLLGTILVATTAPLGLLWLVSNDDGMTLELLSAAKKYTQIGLDETQRGTLDWNPRLFETSGQKWDDLISTGKSCLWKEEESIHTNQESGGGIQQEKKGGWQCQDCGTTERDKCVPLEPRGICKLFNLLNWDASRHRKTAHFRTEAFDHATGWVTTHATHPTNYEQAPCTSDLALPCFDLSRCPKDQPMKVYVYTSEKNGHLTETVDLASKKLPGDIEWTTKHEEACLFVVSELAFETKEEMLNNPQYMAGQNHFIWNSGVFFGAHGDRPHPHHFNFEFAALAAGGFTDAHFRPGYDMSLQLPQVWKRPKETTHLDLHRPRRLLLSFKGVVDSYDAKHTIPFQHHRWLALEYWDTGPDIFVDVRCPYDNVDYHHAKDQSDATSSYGELLLNSTFAFAPGGGGASSFRFQEALAADSIPVVVSYVVLPYSPEIDWSGCVVKVSEARIADLPQILRNMPESEIMARRDRCRVLYRGLIGREQDDKTGDWDMASHAGHAFLFALKIWRQRILKAHLLQELVGELDTMVVHTALHESEFKTNEHFY
ncbi:Exostosin-1 [Seminavis robusta]|uniref:Exostosin-1 n=1 Tax=Seminavis robusta TaxID=568900 RepID=A0A9N8DYR3_9STRA|nr:Exostosin-1 [Seminavis robusta]|eukprot:Sro482_g151830.1 Exostosin-1 (548) ;mRNA; f:36146-37932